MAEEVKNEAKAAKEGDKVSTIAPEDIMIITELAQIGHTQLKAMLPDIKAMAESGKGELNIDNYKHLQSLYDEGGNTITHFSNMCQYLSDAAKALRDLKEGKVSGEVKAVGDK